MHPLGNVMDHTTGTLFLYNMSVLCNMKSVHCDMGPLCEVRSAPCNVGVHLMIWVRYVDIPMELNTL